MNEGGGGVLSNTHLKAFSACSEVHINAHNRIRIKYRNSQALKERERESRD